MTFEADTAAAPNDVCAPSRQADAHFRTAADPEAGWASRNPDGAMLFFFVTPRDCGAFEELMAL